MNRFNLFFIFLLTLVSSALRYSVQDGEEIEMEVRELIHSEKEFNICPEPQKTLAIEQGPVTDKKIKSTVK